MLWGHDLPRRNGDSKDPGPAARLRGDDVLFAFANQDGLILPEHRVHVAVTDGGLAFDHEEEIFLDLIGVAARRFIAGASVSRERVKPSFARMVFVLGAWLTGASVVMDEVMMIILV